MSAAEAPSDTASTRPPSMYFSEEGGDEEPADEERFQEEDWLEEFAREETDLKEVKYLEEEKYLGRDPYEYKGLHWRDNDSPERDYRDSHGYEILMAPVFQSTPSLKERFSTTSSLRSSSTLPLSGSRIISEYSLSMPFSKFHLKEDGTLMTFVDQSTQTEWLYESHSCKEISTKPASPPPGSPGPDDTVMDVEEKEENDVPDKMQVLESLSASMLLEDLMNESSEALEPDDVSSNLRRSNSYQKVFRMMLREMAAQSEIEEDIEIPLTGGLESETRRKLWLLLKKNFGKCKEFIMCFLKKREKLLAPQKPEPLAPQKPEAGILSFRLLNQQPSAQETQKAEQTMMHDPATDGRKMLELDVDWMVKKMKGHQGDGKVILYPTGVFFQILFPDGTGQIYYPSGNLAMLILSIFAGKFIYIILEDSNSMWIRALINNSGHATFYDENRDIWLSLSHNLGYYFTRDCSPKAWNWWDLNLHIHAPPVQPIMLMINCYIQVLIRSQDQILFSFLSPTNRIHLNLGTKYKHVTPEVLSEMKKTRVWEMESHSTVQKIQILLGKMSKILGLTPIRSLETFVGNARAFLEKGFLKSNPW